MTHSNDMTKSKKKAELNDLSKHSDVLPTQCPQTCCAVLRSGKQ